MPSFDAGNQPYSAGPFRPFCYLFYDEIMTASNLIPRLGERIELLDTAIFSGPSNLWRYPACLIHRIKVDRTASHLWFRMKNISLDDEPGRKFPSFLFCYNKHLNYYVTIHGDAAISGLAGDLKAPAGWQDPIFAHQVTYLIRMEIGRTETYILPASNGETGQFTDRSQSVAEIVQKSAKVSWPSFLTGLF